MQTNEQETPEDTEAPEVVEINPASGNPMPDDMRTRRESRWKPVGPRTDGKTMYSAPIGTGDLESGPGEVFFQPLPPVDEAAAEQARESVPVEADDEEDED